jgi:hypothetical protein
MAVNPLQQFFRQPKVYIKLPSRAAYAAPGSFQGDPANVPVYGMTGMDEIVLKTPDSLLSGESTVQVIESCIPAVKDAWEVSIMDINVIFAALRIATFGNAMSVVHTCSKCTSENEYDLDLSKIIEYFTTVQYDNKVVLKDLVIRIRPLTYRQSTDFNLRNFRLQQKLRQTDEIQDRTQQQQIINDLFKELSIIQSDLYKASVESVEVADKVVTEGSFINEWLNNCDKSIYDAIKAQIEANREQLKNPTYPVKCDSCGTEVNLSVELDQSNFFERA